MQAACLFIALAARDRRARVVGAALLRVACRCSLLGIVQCQQRFDAAGSQAHTDVLWRLCGRHAILHPFADVRAEQQVAMVTADLRIRALPCHKGRRLNVCNAFWLAMEAGLRSPRGDAP